MPILSTLSSKGFVPGKVDLLPYPSVDLSMEVFKFTFNNVTNNQLPFVPDVSLNAWTPPNGSRGKEPLSIVDSSYYYNDGSGTNSQGIATLSGVGSAPIPYSTYHNSSIITNDWSLECDIRCNSYLPTSSGVVSRTLVGSGVNRIGFQPDATKSGKFRLIVALSHNDQANSGTSFLMSIPALNANTWHRFTLVRKYTSPTNSKYYAYIDGKLQSVANFNLNVQLYSSSTRGIYCGYADFNFTPDSTSGFALDNLRLLKYNPFPLNGFLLPNN